MIGTIIKTEDRLTNYEVKTDFLSKKKSFHNGDDDFDVHSIESSDIGIVMPDNSSQDK